MSNFYKSAIVEPLKVLSVDDLDFLYTLVRKIASEGNGNGVADV